MWGTPVKTHVRKLLIVSANLTALAYVVSAGFKWGS